jgi:hypothetical protein
VWAARRLAILAAARARRSDFLRLDPGRFRFSLGTSLGDFRVPVELAPDARSIVEAAAGELAALLAAHRFVPADERDRLARAAVHAPPAPVPPRLSPTATGPELRGAARLGAALHPALQGGLLSAWMGPGGRGRSLVGLARELTRRALAEARDTGHVEPTAVLVALALHAELAAQEGRARDLLPEPPLDRYLGAALAIGLWLAARTGIGRAVRDAGRGEDDPALEEVDAALSPGTLLGARAPRHGGDLLYGVDLATGVPRADELAAALAAGADPEGARAALLRALGDDEELAFRAEAAVAVARLRERIFEAVAEGEGSAAAGAVGAARELLAAPGALARACATAGDRRGLAKELSALVVPGRAQAHVQAAALALRGWSDREPAAGLGLSSGEARAAWAAAALALVADAALERIAAPARRALSIVPRDDAAFGGGRLYRLAIEGPILRVSSEQPLGHLFADVKDFTRRTALLGRASVAELLRGEFYGPILAAAAPLHGGRGEPGAVQLNNLLGDAISLSGDIQVMVALAREIRRILDAYEARLRREVSREEVARQLAAIEARHAAALDPVRRALAAAIAELARVPPGTAGRERFEARVGWLAAHEIRLAGEAERELSRARGEGLEAGVFVSHGPPPVEVEIDDPLFGRSRVAIAEKINESARGTSRVVAARSRADAALAAARAEQGGAPLAHAWSVFVDRPLVVAIPPAEERLAVAAARGGDRAAALRALALPVRDALDEVVRAGERPGELWNGGAAVSGEALEAFLRAAGPARIVRRLRLEQQQIPGFLRARWYYGEEALELVATFHPGGERAELFRRAGVASMKGLGDVEVWELAPGGGGAAALFQALGAAWLGR